VWCGVENDVHSVRAVHEWAMRHEEQAAMSQEFVRSSPDVERPVESEGVGRAVRDAHARGLGLARAEVEILNDLPAGGFR
jgi:hypothetical protein